ncbi:MAG: ATP-binding cassette domain-containing protein [Fimbriimonas ginsengisoli]|uniref:ATP-binding cassette domain-containing protein n=1 Tax=Fimbriimonas ginsengisoli TaxID=1005039 RepID=A0A931M025_FIMGI|nr:ATP-binding cassette domain-containing protein [Fimbriimonas ginsengisoli]
MRAAIELSGLVLVNGAGPINLGVSPGESLAVVGPGRGGKSLLISVLAGSAKPAQGRVRMTGVCEATGPIRSRRSTPMSLAPKDAGARAGETLVALGLWNVRKTALSSLSPSQVAACELLGPLAERADVLLVDGTFDRLDPVSLAGALGLLRKRTGHGTIAVVATHRLDLLPHFDLVLALQNGSPVLCGRVDELVASGGEAELAIETDRHAAVRALAEPFAIEVRASNGGIVLRAGDAQGTAARLLSACYGDVRAIVMRRSNPGEQVLAALQAEGRKVK